MIHGIRNYLAAVLILASSANAAVANKWFEASSLKTGRSEVHAATLQDTIYIAGGIGKFRILKSCETYSHSNKKWASCPDLPRRVHHLAMASDGQKVYAAGGYVSLNFRHLKSPKLWSLDPGAQAWDVLAELPKPVGEHIIIWANQNLFLMGGNTLKGDTGETWRYELLTQKWTQMASMPTPRNSMSAIVVEGEIWVLGGRSDAGGSKIKTVEIFNPKNNEWRRGSDMPVGRGGHSAVYLDGKIHIFGGETFDPLQMLDRHDIYDIETDEWLTAAPSPKVRHGTAAVVLRDDIYLIGGAARPGLHTIYSASPVVQVWH